jgi:hypothetical protein
MTGESGLMLRVNVEREASLETVKDFLKHI